MRNLFLCLFVLLAINYFSYSKGTPVNNLEDRHFFKCLSRPKGLNFDFVTTKQGVDDSYPDARIFVNDYRSGKPKKASSETATIFKNSFIELVKSNPEFKKIMKTVAGHVLFKINQINIQSPLIRNNDKKIYNGFVLQVGEELDGKVRLVVAYVYDVDSNALFWYNTSASRAMMQYAFNAEYLARCARYCRFEN